MIETVKYIGGKRKATPEEAAILNARLEAAITNNQRDKIYGRPCAIATTNASVSSVSIQL